MNSEDSEIVLLGISTSLKPAPGRDGKSASRVLLTAAMDVVRSKTPYLRLLDLRERTLPLFDGRLPRDHDDPVVQKVWSEVNRAGALLISIPCYWSGVSGVFKNFIDVLCGPAYDMGKDSATVFTGKAVGCLVVGADATSAEAGSVQAQQILVSTGAVLVSEPIVVVNPRLQNADTKIESLIGLAAELAIRALTMRSAKTAGGSST